MKDIGRKDCRMEMEPFIKMKSEERSSEITKRERIMEKFLKYIQMAGEKEQNISMVTELENYDKEIPPIFSISKNENL